MSHARCLAPLLVALLGCTGQTIDRDGTNGSPPPGPSAAPTPEGPGPSTPVAPLGPPDGSGRAACTGSLQPGPSYLRRLTNDEYARAVAEMLALPEANTPALSTAITLVNEGFGNNADTLNVTTSHLERYVATAQRLAAMAVASPERRMALVGCDAVGTDPCLTSLIRGVGKRAFRRTLADAEVTRLRALADSAKADPEPTMPARVVLQGLLLSPKFLYRVELGDTADGKGWRRLTGPELASRLSFLLWGGPPDAPLLTAAEAGALDTAAGVRARAAEMLDSPRARVGVMRAIAAWLRLADIDDITRAPDKYPLWSEELRGSMREETQRFLDDFLWSKDANLLDAFTAPHTYVNPLLAKVYGMTEGTGWRKVSFGAADPRAGLLTQPAMLALPVSGTEVTAAILRGKFVRDALLCTPPAPPPPDIPPIPADTNLTARERLAQHRDNPACLGCHKLLDPVGLAFEQFDGIGAFHDKGTKGEALTGEGQLFGAAGDPIVRGPKELASLMRQMPDLASCTVTHLFAFAYGRVPLVADACAREELVAAYQAGGHNLRNLLVAMVSSDAFRHVSDVK